jgi:diguanylate cyclase (GGDEF)-like protein
MSRTVRAPSSPFGKSLPDLLDALGKLVEKSASIRSIENLLPDLLEAAMLFSGMPAAAVYLTGDGGETLHLMAEGGALPGPEERRRRLVVGEVVTGRAYQSRKMVLVEDESEEPVLGEHLRGLGMKSQVSLPLVSGGQILGVLDLNDVRPHRFSGEEAAWLQSLAGHIAVLLFGSRLFVQSQAANIQLTRFYDFGSRILAATTFSQALELTAKFALMATTAHSAIIYLIDADGRITLSHGIDNAGREILDESIPLPESLIQEILTGGSPRVLVADELAIPAERETLREKGVVTLVGLPLKIRNQVIGVLSVRYSLPHTFSQAEMDGLTLYAVQVAGTIERLRLLEESRQRESDLRMIIDMARVVTSTLDLEELLQQIAVLLVWTARMDACVISSVDTDRARVRTLAAYSAFGERTDREFGAGYPLADYPMSAQVLKGGDPLLLRIDDPKCHPSEAAILRHLHYGAVLMIPLWAGGKALGLVRLYSRQNNRTFSPLELQRLRVPAEQAALALVNARLYESERQQRILAETLRDIGLVLSGSLRAGTILETLLEQIGRVVPFDSANVMLLQGDRVRVASHRGYERFGLTEWIAHLDLPIERLTGIQHMAATRHPHFIPDVQTDEGWQSVGPTWHVGSWVGAPLVTGDQLLGFLSMDKAERGYYSADHASRLESLAGHAALALLNALTFGEVEQASITDFVTGIYNRRYFNEQLQIEIDRARRIGYPVSLLIFDIDHFKLVNDTYGHPVGDRILQMVARRIKDELRGVDILARYGGEEFAVILPGTPSSSLAGVGERLRQGIAMRPFTLDEKTISITVSTGGATFPDDASDAHRLVDEADRWLYDAKETGRNRTRVPEPMPWPYTAPAEEPPAKEPAQEEEGEKKRKAKQGSRRKKK